MMAPSVIGVLCLFSLVGAYSLEGAMNRRGLLTKGSNRKMATTEVHSADEVSISKSADAGHSKEAVFDLSLGIVTAAYAFEAYATPVRHQFCNFQPISYNLRLTFSACDDAP